MKIRTALMKKVGIRVSYGDKWLVYDIVEWVVYQRKYGAKKTIMICRTDSEDEAVEVLCS